MTENFKSLSELYKRIKPALTSKTIELKRVGLNYIKEEDVWNCIKEAKWQKTNDLSLSEMVNDILNFNNQDIDKYVKNKMSEIPREPNLQSTKI